jgi:hypothetical protein
MFNTVELKSYVISVSGIKASAVMQDFQPAGLAWPTPLDTGGRKQDNIVVEFMYDDLAAGPAVTCGIGTSAALTVTFQTNLSVSGTFIVSDLDVTLSNDGNDKIAVTFTPSGTIAWDLTQ